MKKGSKTIVLFVNPNVSGAVIASSIVPQLLAKGVKPVLFLINPKPKSDALIPELSDFSFYDSLIGQDVIFPFQDEYQDHFLSREYNGAVSIDLVAQKHHVKVYRSDDVHSQSAMKILEKMDNLVGGISIRNMQIFREPVLDLFASKSAFLWNIHGGLLPQYRGVHPTLRAMANGEQYCGWTLHEIDKGIDTGKPLGSIVWPLKADSSYMTEFFSKLESGAGLVMHHVSVVLDGRDPVLALQHHIGQERYYSFPKTSDFQLYKQKGIVFSNSEDVEVYLNDKFGPDSRNKGLKVKFAAAVKAAISEYCSYKSTCDRGRPVSNHQMADEKQDTFGPRVAFGSM